MLFHRNFPLFFSWLAHAIAFAILCSKTSASSELDNFFFFLSAQEFLVKRTVLSRFGILKANWIPLCVR